MKARCLLDLATVAALFACANALPAQRVVDVRSQPIRTFATVSDVCVTIGDGTKGRPEGLLRVTGAAFGKDGLVLLSNTGTSEVLVFDSTGKYLRSVAREGGGPGELSKSSGDGRSQRLLPFRGDSVIVFDTQRWRLLVFDGTGKYARSVSVDRPSTTTFALRAFGVPGLSADGDFALTWSLPPSQAEQQAHELKTIVRRDSITVVRVAADGRAVWRSPLLEANRIETTSRVSRPSAGRVVSESYASPSHLQRFGSAALGSRVIYHYNERANELHVFDRAGALVIRVQLPPMAVPTTGRQSLEMLADQTGRAWINVPQITPGARKEWWVVSENGEMLGSVFTTHGRVLSVGRSKVLLIASDKDGVETIHSCAMSPRG